MSKFYCLVVGSRTFTDYEVLKERLDYFLQNKSDICIVSGGAKGADQLAEFYAKEHDYELKVFKAHWDMYGMSACMIRNKEMMQFISQCTDKGMVAFWDGESSGTRNSIDLSKNYKITCKVVRV